MPVKRKAREAISEYTSLFRSSVGEYFAPLEAVSTTRHSSRNKPMHEVTSWHVSMSAEHNDTKSSVSSLVDAAVRSGTSSDSSDIGYIHFSTSTSGKAERHFNSPEQRKAVEALTRDIHGSISGRFQGRAGRVYRKATSEPVSWIPS